MQNDNVETKTRAQSKQIASTSGVITGGSLWRLPRTVYGTSRWYKKVRKMRLDPTIALVRKLFAAPILVAPWSYESNEDAPDGAVEFIEDQIEPWRRELLRTAVRGALMDFGWQPYEIVISPEGQLQKVKPLLQDITEILIYKDSGDYAGLRQQYDAMEQTGIVIEPEDSLLISFDTEGTDWYGNPIMASAEAPFDRGEETNATGRVYMKKVAGSHWIITYPVGQTPFKGEDKDNFLIAKDLLASLENSGSVAIPVEEQTQLAAGGWSIELKTDSGSSHDTLLDRSVYCDKLKVRAFGFPERSILEGEFGTKAESEAQGSFALTQLELRHLDLVDPINYHLVNRLLRLNFGDQAENTVWIQPQALHDSAIATLKAFYDKVLTNPEGLSRELEAIDMEAVRTRLEMPADPDALTEEDFRLNDEPEDDFQDELPGINDMLEELLSI